MQVRDRGGAAEVSCRGEHMSRIDEGWIEGPVALVQMHIRHAKEGWVWIECPHPPVEVLEDLSDGWGGIAIGAETWGMDERTLQQRRYRVCIDAEATRARDEFRAERERKRAERREKRREQHTTGGKV